MKQKFKIFVKTPKGTESHELEETSFTIGRSRKANITVPTDGISREHMRVELKNDKIFVTDLKSSNGTVVNKKMIKAGEPHEYHVGEKIQIKGVKVIFTVQLEAASLEDELGLDESDSYNLDADDSGPINLDEHVSVDESQEVQVSSSMASETHNEPSVVRENILNFEPKQTEAPVPAQAAPVASQTSSNIAIDQNAIAQQAEFAKAQEVESVRAKCDQMVAEAKKTAEEIVYKAQTESSQLINEAQANIESQKKEIESNLQKMADQAKAEAKKLAEDERNRILADASIKAEDMVKLSKDELVRERELFEKEVESKEQNLEKEFELKRTEFSQELESEKKAFELGQQKLEVQLREKVELEREEVLTEAKKAAKKKYQEVVDQVEIYKEEGQEQIRKMLTNAKQEAQKSLDDAWEESSRLKQIALNEIAERKDEADKELFKQRDEITAEIIAFRKEASDNAQAEIKEAQEEAMRIRDEANEEAKEIREKLQNELSDFEESAKIEAKSRREETKEEVEGLLEEARKTIETSREEAARIKKEAVALELEAKENARKVMRDAYATAALLKNEAGEDLANFHAEAAGLIETPTYDERHADFSRSIVERLNSIDKEMEEVTVEKRRLAESEQKILRENIFSKLQLEAKEETLQIISAAEKEAEEIVRNAYINAKIITTECHNTILEKQNTHERELEELKSSIFNCKEELESLENNRHETKKNLEYLKTLETELTEKTEIADEELKSLQTRIDVHQNQFSEDKLRNEEEILKLKNDISEIHGTKQELLSEFNTTKGKAEVEIQGLKKQIEILDSEHENLETRRNHLTIEVEGLQSEKGHLTSSNAELGTENRRLESKNETLDQDILQKQEHSNRLASEIDELREKNSSLKGEVQYLEQELGAKRSEVETYVADLKRSSESEAETLIAEAKREAEEITSKIEREYNEKISEADSYASETVGKAKEEEAEIRKEIEEMKRDRVAYVQKEIDELKAQADRDVKGILEEANTEKNKILDQTRSEKLSILDEAKEEANAMKLEAVEKVKEIQAKIEEKNEEMDNKEVEMKRFEEETKKNAQMEVIKMTEKAQEDINGLKDQAREQVRAFQEEAKAKIKEKDEALAEEHKAILAKAGQEAQAKIQAAEAKAKEILGHTAANAESLKKKAEDEARAAVAKKDQIISSIEADAKARQTELNTQLDEHKKATENEIAEMKIKENEEAKQREENAENLRFTRRNQEIKDIAENIKMQMQIKLKEKFGEKASEMSDLTNGIKEIVKRAMTFEEGEGKKAKGMLMGSGKMAGSVKKFYLKVGLAVGIPLILLILHFIFPNMYSSMGTGIKSTFTNKNEAADLYLQKEMEKRRNKPKYQPAHTAGFKATYTDNIIYTRGYKETVVSEKFINEWTIALSTYVTEDLGLYDNVIVNIISYENNMHNLLLENFGKVNPQFVKEGVGRMRETENEFLAKLQKVLKSEDQYNQFWEYKEKFFVDYLQNNPVEVPEVRAPASETED